MSLASRLLTALVGLGLIWYYWPFGGEEEVVRRVEPPPAATDTRLFTNPAKVPNALETRAAEKAAQAGAANDKDRESVTAAIAPEAASKATPKPKVKPKRFYRVVVIDSGTLKAGDVTINLDGIKAHAADATCKDRKGRTWACGTRARAALTRLIRSRAVVCKVPQSANAKSLTARCSLAGTDLSQWMVRHGWVKPTAPTEAKLAEAAEHARKKQIGIWR